MAHRRTHNRIDVQKYSLSGFIQCGSCGKSLVGQTIGGYVYYRHKADGCSLKAVRGDQVEPAILDYLYGAFLDKPNYDKAIERALPSTEHRQGLIKELERTEKQMAKNAKAIDRLVDAITKGVDPILLIGKQDQLKAEQDALGNQFQTLTSELAEMPSAESTRAAAAITRIYLMQQHTGKDWRELSHDEIQQFLFHLFGAAKLGSERGIFISQENGKIVATFKGQVEFQDWLVDGHTANEIMSGYAEMYGKEIKRDFEMAVQKIRDERQAKDVLRPITSDLNGTYLTVTN